MPNKRSLLNFSSNSYSRFLSRESRESALDIDFFRRSVALHYQYLYVTKKRLNKAHRMIFFGLSALFIFLSICIYFKTSNFTCGLYLGECNFIKHCVDGSCLLLSALTFGLGYLTQPDREALRFLVKKVENDLRSPAHHLQIELSQIFKNLINEHVQLQDATWIPDVTGK